MTRTAEPSGAATGLVYLLMSLIGLAIAHLVFGSGPLWRGMILLGTLPTDVSSPLLVWIARGNVVLATVFNAINTALAPVLIPLLFRATPASNSTYRSQRWWANSPQPCCCPPSPGSRSGPGSRRGSSGSSRPYLPPVR